MAASLALASRRWQTPSVSHVVHPELIFTTVNIVAFCLGVPLLAALVTAVVRDEITFFAICHHPPPPTEPFST